MRSKGLFIQPRIQLVGLKHLSDVMGAIEQSIDEYKVEKKISIQW
jgi:hypothetical protein